MQHCLGHCNYPINRPLTWPRYTDTSELASHAHFGHRTRSISRRPFLIFGISNGICVMATQASRMRVQQALTFRAKFNQMSQHGFASRTSPRLKVKTDSISPLYRFGGVHGGASHQKTWRNKPLFRREVRAEFARERAVLTSRTSRTSRDSRLMRARGQRLYGRVYRQRFDLCTIRECGYINGKSSSC